MIKTLKLLSLILILALSVPALSEGLIEWPDASPSLAPTPSPTPAASKLKDDGLIRVWLKSLESPQALHLTLQGSYAVEGSGGFYFSRNAQITLTASDGDVWLTSGGLTIDMGPALTLTRHAVADDGPNGLYIDESAQPNLYCGDLSLTATGDGLRAVLTLPVEDYLAGVVAYEMSDSFPLEALKAQAVAARTYALKRKWSAGRRDYDLVDTTADQVFKGYDPEYENVLEAVRATRGLVGTYKGGFATCYYTASNGGQTALASQIWGSDSADGYLAMTDDPYDLENPSSLENDLSFTADCEGSEKLRRMLTDALADIMSEEGFDDYILDSIAAIEPVDPRFEGSRIFDGLAFDLRVMVPESALATPTPEPTDTPTATPSASPSVSPSVSPSASPKETSTLLPDLPPEPEKWVPLDDTRRVTLPVFDDIKDGLSMGLNSADCELISVETFPAPDGTAASFRLVMRRFGHGVGMSQRGAQWMAGQYGMDFMEILSFYYPGMTMERMDWPEHTLEPIDALPAAIGAERPMPTPTPSPAPLPKARKGERVATVAATSLNVREQPTTLSRIVDVLDRGRQLLVSSEPDEDGWVAIRTGDVEGFVKAEYLD